jgi:hypothetical protein
MPPPAQPAPASYCCLRGPQGAVRETSPPAQPAPASHRRLRGPQGVVGETPPPVVCPSKILPPVGTDVEHHIKTSGPPIASRFRRLDAEKLAAAKAEFLQLEKDGIVRRSDSPWSSPLHMVRKAEGTWRPCGDFRRLNMVTVADSYPLPNMLDFVGKAAGCTIFSKIDLRKGYCAGSLASIH